MQKSDDDDDYDSNYSDDADAKKEKKLILADNTISTIEDHGKDVKLSSLKIPVSARHINR